ncbi:MAG: leucyl aminopeptidase [Alphaproteobacteria bacterium]|nr:leucyl aminopeptidase [Alphaproteobacteria bacterium]
MRISFAELKIPARGIVIVGVGAKNKLSSQAERVDKQVDGALARAVAAARFTGKLGEYLAVLAPAGRKNATYLLVGTGPAKEFGEQEAQIFGAAAYRAIQSVDGTAAIVLADVPSGAPAKLDDIAAHLAYGARLRSYSYDKYKTGAAGTNNKNKQVGALTVMVRRPAMTRRRYMPLSAIAAGVEFSRNLVSEPSNVKSPKWMSTQCRKLSKLGVRVEVLGEAQMRKLGMHALLGVGQGSVQESQCVVMRWNGGKIGGKPLALVGKGVTFDTGGISIKPAGGMEDMIWDMGGAGAVIGTMHALAGRKAKANVVGVVGLTENMPDGNAQRPGDIVRSMSGQTIEVINTDAEGRLVLADMLWYTQKRFKPDAMIDLATLTGAVVVALGHEYAGLYANKDQLADRIISAGKAVGEKLWHLPLDPAYDKQINTPRADMKNVGPRWGGSITAAQFLQRFTNGLDWAHLDIAGVAWSDTDRPLLGKGATGFGVRALDRFIRDNYEGK